METALANTDATALAIAQTDTDELAEILAANLGDSGFTPADLDRVKVPSGGLTVWTIPGIEGNSHSEELVGVVVHWQARKAYWSKSMEEGGGGSPPDCRSDDLKIGIGNPGGPCLSCPYNQFGSARRGDGKACKDVLQLFLVRGDDILPTIVTVPPSSIKNVRQYFMRLLGKRVKFSGAITRLKLAETKSGSGVAYSEIIPSLVRVLSPEEKARVDRYAAAVSAAAGAAPVQQTDVDAPGPEGDVDYWRKRAIMVYQQAGGDPADQAKSRAAFAAILGCDPDRSRSDYTADDWAQIVLHYSSEPAGSLDEDAPPEEFEQVEELPFTEDEDPKGGKRRAKVAVEAGETAQFAQQMGL